ARTWGAVRPGRAVQHPGARPGATTSPAATRRAGPQARGAVPAGGRVGEEPAGVALGAADGPRRGEGTARSRRAVGASAGQAGGSDWTRGAVDRDAVGGRVAHGLRAVQRGRRGPP